MKLTKMQLNRVEDALLRETESKIKQLEHSIKLPLAPNNVEIGVKWAKKNPASFAKKAEDMLRESGYNDISRVYKDSPAAIKAVADHKKMVVARNKKISAAEIKLAGERSRIMDELYLLGADDAMAEIKAFKAFTV